MEPFATTERSNKMLNIRKEQTKLEVVAVLAIYVLLIGVAPFAVHARADQTDGATVTAEAVRPDPLADFRNAKSLDKAELKELLQAVGFEGKALRTAWAVAMKESNGRPTAHNDDTSTGDNSYGIFQINMLGDLGVDRREKFNLLSNKELLDPVTNAKIAYHMTDGGRDWSSWKVYKGQINGERFENFYKEFPSI
jgi:Lysozyme like domain